MIIYRVVVTIDSQIENKWVDWMQKNHIPTILQTGCFTRCSMCRIVESANNSNRVSYVMQYHCNSLDDYVNYRDKIVPELQKEHAGVYAGRPSASREILEEVYSLVVSKNWTLSLVPYKKET